jgi:hypothetical protein
MPHEADSIRAFLGLVAPGFTVEGVLPAGSLEGIEILDDAHAVAGVQTEGGVLPLRFTFDEGKIARVEVL